MKNNNQINVPQAREAMDKFKMQAASEVGVNLTNGYNGHLIVGTEAPELCPTCAHPKAYFEVHAANY